MYTREEVLTGKFAIKAETPEEAKVIVEMFPFSFPDVLVENWCKFREKTAYSPKDDSWDCIEYWAGCGYTIISISDLSEQSGEGVSLLPVMIIPPPKPMTRKQLEEDIKEFEEEKAAIYKFGEQLQAKQKELDELLDKYKLPTPTADIQQQLFNYLANELGVTALQSNLSDIISIVTPTEYPYVLTPTPTPIGRDIGEAIANYIDKVAPIPTKTDLDYWEGHIPGFDKDVHLKGVDARRCSLLDAMNFVAKFTPSPVSEVSEDWDRAKKIMVHVISHNRNQSVSVEQIADDIITLITLNKKK